MMLLSTVIHGFLSAIVPLAHAQRPPINCPGCTAVEGGELLNTFMTNLYEILTTTVGAGAVAGLVWSGLLFVYANGDEGKVTKAKTAAFASIGGAVLTLAAGSIVGTIIYRVPSSGFDPATILAALTNQLLEIFNAAMVIVIILGGIRMATAAGKADEFQKGISAIKWSLIGGLVANLSKAILDLVLQL